MDILLTFPYAGLESELEKIVERRARSSDVLSMKLYYSFLYAFHVRQGKMRKAAAVMYEQVHIDNIYTKSAHAWIVIKESYDKFWES